MCAVRLVTSAVSMACASSRWLRVSVFGSMGVGCPWTGTRKRAPQRQPAREAAAAPRGELGGRSGLLGLALGGVLLGGLGDALAEGVLLGAEVRRELVGVGLLGGLAGLGGVDAVVLLGLVLLVGRGLLGLRLLGDALAEGVLGARRLQRPALLAGRHLGRLLLGGVLGRVLLGRLRDALAVGVLLGAEHRREVRARRLLELLAVLCGVLEVRRSGILGGRGRGGDDRRRQGGGEQKLLHAGSSISHCLERRPWTCGEVGRLALQLLGGTVVGWSRTRSPSRSSSCSPSASA